MFESVSNSARFPELEQKLLALWRDRRIYEKSLEQRAGCPKFVFYEGPPTANGMPHPGHCLTRAIKDLFPRYRTMRGYQCERKAGWDTHGLPVEVEVCKELGIHSKEEIESYGIEPFIHKCQESVWRYMKEWERLTERLGFWIHLDEAYVTYHQSYVESVWWSLKNLFDRGLLYQGHKIVWWWAQGGTALSAGEVGQGYREVADPSVYVLFPLVGQENTSLLVWTTTPWTLPSNQFAAVHPELEYAVAVDSETGEKIILAKDLVETVAGKVKRELSIESTCRGEELIGRRYVPPFEFYYRSLGEKTGRLKVGGCDHVGWRVLSADFVTIDSGTGVVHQAPAFGEVDYDVLIADQARFESGDRPELICAVAPDGKFTDEAPDFAGRWVKEADKDICRDMRRRGRLYHQEQYLHDYPFCWRADDDPLIQYPRRSWFIRTTQFKDRLLANNQQINWLPTHIRNGRFGNFLETNVDWALSRERYWGTPLPIWVCSASGQMEAVANYDELLAKPGLQGVEVWEEAKKKTPSLPDDLRVHKPYIDAVSYDSPFDDQGRMQCVSEVIDCWYDSGAMPFAQWGYPKQGAQEFEGQFPADFISEALDQTRGWFYSLLAISTLVFGDEEQSEIAFHQFPHPYRNCIVLGLMLSEWWECGKCKTRTLEEASKCEQCGGNLSQKSGKMSKSLRNYREPNQIFDRYGADALRWYLFANQAPWNSILYSERAIRESIPEFLLRLWNVFSFFVMYANIDGFEPEDRLAGQGSQLASSSLAKARGYRPVNQRGELDRWILSELHRTVAAVTERMDAYDNHAACVRLSEFVDDLSNWYVRRSRDRFWGSEVESTEKLDAHWTLYECLITTSKLVAPFTPFLAESLWQNLAGVLGDRAVESVHLCDYPECDSAPVDEILSHRMRLLREIASLGRSARMEAKLKVRQPLSKVEVILADMSHQPWLQAHDSLLCEELNVKQVEYTTEADQYITYQVQPNFPRLGPRLGRQIPKVKQALANADGAALMRELESSGKVTLTLDGEPVELDTEDVQIRLQAKAGWAAAQGTSCVVVLSTELTDELIAEGLARDLVRNIQECRKALDCERTDRIAVGMVTEATDLCSATEKFLSYVMGETLAVSFVFEAIDGVEPIDGKIAGSDVNIYLKVVNEAATE